MRKEKICLIMACCLSLGLWLLAGPALAQPKVGDKVPNLKFGKPMSQADIKYLGLEKMAPFTLKDVQAKYVLVDVFSTT